jgi:hypothetical protein
MKIETFCIAYPEDILRPYFTRHYEQFSDITFIYSEIGVIDDAWFIEVKNSCWKNSKADWVIIVDADEFVYSPNIIYELSKTEATILSPDFYDMYSDALPVGNGQIFDEIFMGKKDKPKMNIFRPDAIRDINYDYGCHVAHPSGKVVFRVPEKIRTLHMRYLSLEYTLATNKRGAERMTERNRINKWGYHVYFSTEKVTNDFNEAKKHLIDVRL